jgi:4-hydroxy-tetrahydrodipicolinate synthase
MIFRGLAAYPITPADPDGRVDVEGLSRLVAPLVAAGVDAVGLLGSTGTYAYLSRAERRRAVAAAAEVVAGRAPLMVGVGALRTDEAVALARDAEAAGADALLLAAVSYTPLTEAEVERHVLTLAGATGLPICLYDNPSTTNFAFSPALVERLATAPTIRAVKRPPDPAGEAAGAVAALRARLPAGFSIGCSGDWIAAETLLAGGDMWHGVAAGLLPGPALALTRAAMAGDAAEAARLDAAFAPLWALFREFGSLRVAYAMAPALGVSDAAPPLPLLPLGAGDRARVAAALEALAI